MNSRTETLDPRAYEARMREALQTMDVVDQLRHNEAALAALAANDEASLRQRLAEIYRSQGVHVSDEALAAGIKAQREKRFVHTPYSGRWLTLAKLWVNRRAVAVTAARFASVVAILGAAFVLAYWMPKEARIDRNITWANEIVVSLRAGLLGAEQELADKVMAFRELSASIDSERLVPAKLKLGGDVDAVAASLPGTIQSALATTPAEIRREDWKGASENEELVSVARDNWTAVGAALERIDQATTDLSKFHMLEQQLLLSNRELLARALSPDMQAQRAATFDAGVAAMTAVDLTGLQRAAANLAGFVAVFAELDEIPARAEALYRRGVATGPTDSAGARLQRERAAVLASASPSTIEDARDAMDVLKATVEELDRDYRFRIVSRAGVQSGVWRYNADSPNARNHYLVVEAIDGGNEVVALPITNEETGKRQEVVMFAVRVTEDEYERVKADKLDNGLIDKPWVGAKPRGHLEPTFSVEKAGGYITNW